jgi:hypothetical protein
MNDILTETGPPTLSWIGLDRRPGEAFTYVKTPVEVDGAAVV